MSTRFGRLHHRRMVTKRRRRSNLQQHHLLRDLPLPLAARTGAGGRPAVEAIAEAARALVAQRDAWLHPAGASEAELKKRTLTNLYNARPTWLDLAHRKLDAAVLDAYGWPHDLSDEEILERLLGLNLERAEQRIETNTCPGPQVLGKRMDSGQRRNYPFIRSNPLLLSCICSIRCWGLWR